MVETTTQHWWLAEVDGFGGVSVVLGRLLGLVTRMALSTLR